MSYEDDTENSELIELFLLFIVIFRFSMVRFF